MEYKRGDIFYVNWKNTGDDTVGSEQQPGRPAVIVSNDLGNEYSQNVTVIYLTSKEKRPMAVHVPVICKVQSTALCEQIYTVSKERLGEYVRTCTDAEMQAIDTGICYALGLNQPATVPHGDVPRVVELEAMLEAEKGNVQVLSKTLKEAEMHAKEQRMKIEGLQRQIERMEEESDRAEETRQTALLGYNVSLCRAEAERDVYKNLFESLQAQMMERRV